MINPQEDDHIELIRLIDLVDKKILALVESESENTSVSKMKPIPELEASGKQIVAQSQIVLKKEWVRVKSGQ